MWFALPCSLRFAHAPLRTRSHSAKDFWWVGVTFIFASGAVAALGFIVSKISSVYEDSKPREQRVQNIFRRPLTWLGMCTTVLIPAPLDLASLMFARYSLLAPFASLSLVFNMVGAHVLLDEQVGWVEVASTAMIITGCAMTTIFGSHDDTIFSLTHCPNEEIVVLNRTANGTKFRSEPCLCGPDVAVADTCPGKICNCVNLSLVFHRPEAYAWLGFCAIAVATSALVWAKRRPVGTTCCVGRVVRKREDSNGELDDDDDFRDTPAASVSSPPRSGVRDRAVSVKKPPLNRAFAYSFGIIAGVAGALQQIGFKASLEMIHTSAQRAGANADLTHPMFPLLLLGAVGFAILQLVSGVSGDVGGARC